MSDRYGDRRAGEHAWAHGESVGKKITRKETVHTPENEEARLEDLETIKALREKVARLREAEVEINMLREQIEGTTEETLPALTGERVKRLKELQEGIGVDDSAEKLMEYTKKLQAAEARYRTVFPDFPLPDSSSEDQEIRN